MPLDPDDLDLDLAFSADGVLPPPLIATAGPWADPEAGAASWQELLRGWLGQLAAELPPELRSPAYSLGLNLVGDGQIAELNAHWRGLTGPTDVLAFAAREDGLEAGPPPPMPPGIEGDPDPLELGDIVISLETAARQADDHGHHLVRELQFLASHGLLHLLGWDHPDDTSLAAMLARQERLLT
jgi:probable rRNA maturation factor